jgi:molecular chaperone DnaJ
MEHEMNIDLISALRGFETELAMHEAKACARCQGSGIDPKSRMTMPACGGSGRLNAARGPSVQNLSACKGHNRRANLPGMQGGQVVARKIRVHIPRR